MRKNISWDIRLISPVFTLSILPLPGHALTPGQVFDKVKNSVVVVKTLDAQGRLKIQGSGVLISFGRIATNCHVVEGGVSFYVGRGKHFVSATLYSGDSDKDICILDAEGIGGEVAQFGKAANLKVGDPVYAVGAPKGYQLPLSDGIVAQLRGDSPPFIQTTAAISHGSSGGGLFDGEGRLVGLTTLFIKGGQSLNFAMPVEWINEIKPGRKPVAEGRGQTEWVKNNLALEQMKDWQGMLDWCWNWTKSEPENAFAWYSLGFAHANLKRYNDAIEAFHQALRINPADYTNVWYNPWYNLGVVYGKLKRYDDAIKAYNQALHINPDYTSALNNLGFIYTNLKRYDDAIDAYRKAVRIDLKNAFAWYNLGFIYTNLKHYDDAIDAYRKAVRINPEFAEAWYNLGNVYGELNRHNDAIEAFRQAIRINPAYVAALGNLGEAYFLSGNRAAALEAVKELRRLDPAQADKLFDLIVPR